jgi:hypothetical protein
LLTKNLIPLAELLKESGCMFVPLRAKVLEVLCCTPEKQKYWKELLQVYNLSFVKEDELDENKLYSATQQIPEVDMAYFFRKERRQDDLYCGVRGGKGASRKVPRKDLIKLLNHFFLQLSAIKTKRNLKGKSKNGE